MISIKYKILQQGARPDEMQIDLDAEGLRVLMAELQLLQEGRTDHLHLMSEAWGGTHLVDQPESDGAATIHHLKIILRNEL
jgi:Immunity protein 32